MEGDSREPQIKRRKVRKGTRSCWECKGRKVRCTWMTDGDTVCDGCFRRGTSCVSQELPEHPLGSIDRRRQMGNRIVRVETLIEKLVKRTEEGPKVPEIAISAHSESVTPTAPSTADSLTRADAGVAEQPEGYESRRLEKLSEALLNIFPSKKGVEMVVKMAGPMPSFFHQLMRSPVKDFRMGQAERDQHTAELNIRYTPQTHPLIIVRQMLLLAIFFRYIHPDFQPDLEGFSETPGTVIQRLAQAAINLINAEDNMMDTIDGLECLLLTCTFQADSGNLRSAWSTIRRAISKAQLMCLHRHHRPPLRTIQPENRWDPQCLWFRIVYYDRFYSLILGLPQGSSGAITGSLSPSVEDTIVGHFERGHCSLAGRILQRNERDVSNSDLVETEAIDRELRKLSESMPSKWWLLPNLASIQDSEELFWATVKISNQLFHYILLSHLHLPFILRTSSGPDPYRFEYSRMACINASRDLLFRYRALRSFQRGSYCCHSMDFFAITASMTLVLAHLDAHCSPHDQDKALVHQRIPDRAMMEEILDNMEQVGILHKAKTISEKGAGVLRQLLAIEADAARSPSYRLQVGNINPDDTRALRLSIPYFGTVTIIQNNRASLSAPESFVLGARNNASLPLERSLCNVSPTAAPQEIISNEKLRLQQQPQGISSASLMLSDNSMLGEFSNAQSLNHNLSADEEDYILQGADLGFFESLVRDSDTQMNELGEFWWLSEEFSGNS